MKTPLVGLKGRMESVYVITAKPLEPSSALDCFAELLCCQARFDLACRTNTLDQKYARLMKIIPEWLVFISNHNIDLTTSRVGLINNLSSSNGEVARQMQVKKGSNGRLGSRALQAAMLERGPTLLQGPFQLRVKSPEHPT